MPTHEERMAPETSPFCPLVFAVVSGFYSEAVRRLFSGGVLYVGVYACGEFSGGACVPPLASRQTGTLLIGDRGDLDCLCGDESECRSKVA